MADQYAIYLRKSRADMEAESRGEGETLARHRASLLELARKQKLSVAEVYEELVSGDTIQSRPEIQKLLKKVEKGVFAGVLCMEIERLARGDSIDQGIIARTFKYSSTKIITPTKTYDPSNEYDEEYFEFSLFMSRREYKTINRRMQAGRLASVKEGNYIGANAPYGYKKVHDYENRCYTLEPVPEEADAVRLMYDLYINHDLGYSKIATHLNNLGIKPKRIDTWSRPTVKAIIENPLYYGKLRWNWRKNQKVMENGKVKITNPINHDYEVYDGLHPAIVDETMWKQAETIRNSSTHTRTQQSKELKNQFAGLMYCKLCGRAMVRRPYTNGDVFLMCNHNGCNCVSSKFSDVDKIVYDTIVRTYKEKLKPSDNKKINNTSNIAIEKSIVNELDKIKTQQNKLYDLLEQEIYTTEVFVERSKALSIKKQALEKELVKIKSETVSETDIKEALLQIKYVIDTYNQSMSIKEKNALLKSIIKKIEYERTERGSKGSFKITIKFLY
jgi:DNA invertase Pin-like site-specific DNA recombinase